MQLNSKKLHMQIIRRKSYIEGICVIFQQLVVCSMREYNVVHDLKTTVVVETWKFAR